MSEAIESLLRRLPPKARAALPASSPLREADARPAAPWSDRVLEVESQWFTKLPARRTWLLRDRRTPGSDGVLPLGKVGQLVAEGGGGKTMVLVQLAVAVATGTRWLGALDVASPGRVLAILGEEDFEESQRRMYFAARASNAPPPADGMIVALPLAGLPSEMVCRDPDGNPMDAPFLRWLREYLSTHNDWRLIVVDPLSRFAGLEAEKDNAQATRFIEALESIALQTGATVLVAHHSNQASRGGGRMTTTSSRGVTALFDGVRWAATMGVDQVEGLDPLARERLGEIVTVEFKKSNYSRKGEPIPLRRDLDNGGALVPLDQVDLEIIAAARKSTEPVAVRRAEKDDATRARAVSVEETIVAIVRETPGISARGIIAAVRLRLGACADRAVTGAIALLVDEGVVSRSGTRATGHKHSVGAASEVVPNPPSQEVLRAARPPL